MAKPTIVDLLQDRDTWHARAEEPVIDPDREIVDPHHHLWERPDSLYTLDAFHADTGSGHNIVQTVFVQCHAWHDRDGPRHLRPVGETRRVAEIAAASEGAQGATIAGIVAHCDLRLDPALLDEVLDGHAEAAGGRFRGIRHSAAFPVSDTLTIPGHAPEGLYADADFRRGVRRLGERGLTYDAWHYHVQNGEFVEMARACPDTTMVLDHFGTPLGVAPFDDRDARFDDWRRDMAAVAACPNVRAKLGGLAMPDNGFGWHERDLPPSSDDLAETNAPYYRHMVEVFGPERCMLESNFPVDKVSVSYRTLWNAMKKMTADLPDPAKEGLFAGTARRVYSL